MNYPIACPSCGEVSAELAANRASAVCNCGREIPVSAFVLGPGCVLAGGYRIVKTMPDPEDGFIAVQESVDRRVQVKVLSLARRIDRLGAIPERDALALLLPIAEAINHAWRDRQIIHRNLKPTNVVVADDVPMLADLTIAKTAAAGASLTGVGYALGTPEYMSPEQARGEE